MSADLLRRAAAAMRDTAQVATPGPWTYDGNPSGAVWPVPYPATLAYVQPRRDGMPVVYAIENGNAIPTETQTANARHIASWHPAVALAVADWLDYEAGQIGPLTTTDGRELTYVHGDPYAVTVARAYLGVES